MTARDWIHISEIALKARSLDEQERRAYLDEACGDDEVLRQAVDELLVTDEAVADDAIDGMLEDDLEGDSSGGELTGNTLGRYRVGALLGQGGMGEVYRCNREDLGRTDALKVLHRDLKTSGFLQRFEQEKITLSGLNHPHIATFYDAGTTDDGRPFLVMELVADGRPILAFCDEEGSSIEERIRLFQKVCRAVEYAHRQMIVHGDIKGSNILIDSYGEPRLVDFGIAKNLDPTTRDQAELTVGNRLMTLASASPEQVQGKPLRAESDVYSLGVLLYRLLSGRSPYELADRVEDEARRIVCDETPTEPSKALGGTSGDPTTETAAIDEHTIRRTRRMTTARLRRYLSGDLDRIVMMAIRKEPDRRYRSPNDFSNDLELFLDGMPVTAQVDSGLYRARKFVRRNPLRTLLVILILAFGVVYSASTAYQLERVTQAEQATEEVVTFLVGMFELPTPDQALGQEITAKKILDVGLNRARSGFTDRPAIQARLLHTLGVVYRQMGQYSSAASPLEDALALRVENRNHAEAVETLAELAWLARLENDSERALELAGRALAMHRDRSETGPDSAETEGFLIDLQGLIEQAGGRYDEGESLHRQAIAIFDEEGERGDKYASAVHNLGIALRNQGEYDEARQHFDRSSDLMFEIHGDRSTKAIRVARSRAWNLFLAGDLAAAEPALREVLTSSRTVFGDDHPEVGTDTTNLAQALKKRGELLEARRLFELAVDNAVRTLGPEHPNVARISLALAGLLRYLGEIDEAEALLRQAAASLETSLGGRHPHVAIAQGNLGRALLDGGKFDEAEQLIRSSLDLRREVLGPEHPYVMVSLEDLGELHRMRGEYEDAERVLGEALAMARPQKGHSATRVEVGLAAVLIEQGRVEQALSLVQPGVSASHEMLPTGHWWLGMAESLLGRCLSASGEHNAAEDHLRQAVAILRERLPDEHPLLALAEMRLGRTLLHLNRVDEARSMLERPLEFLLRPGRVSPASCEASRARDALRTALGQSLGKSGSTFCR